MRYYDILLHVHGHALCMTTLRTGMQVRQVRPLKVDDGGKDTVPVDEANCECKQLRLLH